jgi:hypothetical protein
MRCRQHPAVNTQKRNQIWRLPHGHPCSPRPRERGSAPRAPTKLRSLPTLFGRLRMLPSTNTNRIRITVQDPVLADWVVWSHPTTQRAHRSNNRQCLVHIGSPAQVLNSFGRVAPPILTAPWRSLRSLAAIPSSPEQPLSGPFLESKKKRFGNAEI